MTKAKTSPITVSFELEVWAGCLSQSLVSRREVFRRPLIRHYYTALSRAKASQQGCPMTVAAFWRVLLSLFFSSASLDCFTQVLPRWPKLSLIFGDMPREGQKNETIDFGYCQTSRLLFQIQKEPHAPLREISPISSTLAARLCVGCHILSSESSERAKPPESSDIRPGMMCRC